MAKRKITSIVIEQSRTNIFVIVHRMDGRNGASCNIYHSPRLHNVERQFQRIERGVHLMQAALKRNRGAA